MEPRDKVLLLQKFASHLTRIRKEKGLSIHELADASDLEYSQVQRIEKGLVNFEFTTLRSLATGLEMTLEELFAGLKLPS